MLTHLPDENTVMDKTTSRASLPLSGAYWTLGLLLAMNMFNYIDRTILAAVEPQIRATLLSGLETKPNEPAPANKLGSMGGVLLAVATRLYGPHAERALSGLLASAFLLSYMISAPIFGALSGRMSRWHLIGIGVLLWSLATGAGGLAATFTALFLTRCFVGVGEGAYGPLAPALIADAFPLATRGRMLSLFYIALPVGGALGYVLGGQIAHWNEATESWRWAFYIVVGPGLLLGLLSFLMREIKPTNEDGSLRVQRKASWHDLKILWQTPSYVYDTLGMTAMTFGMGALVWWMPDYLETHGALPLWGVKPVSMFGMLTALAGLFGTIGGGSAGDRLRKLIPGSYFLVSGIGLAISGSGRAVVPLLFAAGRVVDMGMAVDICLRLLYVLQHRSDERHSGQRDPSDVAADCLCGEHLCDPHIRRRAFASANRRHCRCLEYGNWICRRGRLASDWRRCMVLGHAVFAARYRAGGVAVGMNLLEYRRLVTAFLF